MVTCVDVCGYSVMSASLDGSVALWDLRNTDTHGTINAVAVAAQTSVRDAGWVVLGWVGGLAGWVGAPNHVVGCAWVGWVGGWVAVGWLVSCA